jgi:benzoyl-CoA reductase/2-hydroxyglutaryl-CoA dehydratase subunit BcrC/BadD/HgdB
VQADAKFSIYAYPWEAWKQWNEITYRTWENNTSSSKSTEINPFSFYCSWIKAIESLQEQVKANTPQFDALVVWKQWLDTTMDIWQQVAHIGGDPLRLMAGWIKIMENMSEEYSKTLHFPASSDIASLTEIVVNMEAKINNIEDALDRINKQFLLLLIATVE